MKESVYERARKYIAKLPPAVQGSGGNAATYAAAATLVVGFDMSDGDALALMQEWNMSHCNPPWSEKELERMVRNARTRGGDKPAGYLLKGNSNYDGKLGAVAAEPRKRADGLPPYDEGMLKKYAAMAPSEAVHEKFFMERSPVDVREMTAEKFIDYMFLPDERVLIFTDFKSQGQFLRVAGKKSYRLSRDRDVKAVESELPRSGAEGVWYLNQPVTGQWAVNGENMYSRRSEPNITAWKHLILESDVAPTELWLRFVAMVSGGWVKAIYSSGGKSWHVLLGTHYESKAHMDADLLARAKKTFALLGADPRALTAVRLTRLPCCKRGMREQRLIYLNPRKSVEPIMSMPVLRKV